MYIPKIYREPGGNKLVVANGGRMEFESGAEIVFPNPYGAQDYFVDGNSAASGDGLSWATAFATLAEAITASNASIVLSANRWWARRNRIFVCGDTEINEDLTVLPEKCDIIGTGYDVLPFPRIIGNHTIAVTRPNLSKANGCRWINCGFTDESGTLDVFAVPALCHGLSFLGCHFFAKAGGSTGKALEITNCAHVRIEDCIFGLDSGQMASIFALAISIEGASSIHDCMILRNRITATLGIDIAAAGGAAFGSLIAENIIRATGYAIDDQTGDFQVVNNRWMTDIDTTTAANGYNFNLQLAAGNIQMGVTGLGDSVPFMKIAE